MNLNNLIETIINIDPENYNKKHGILLITSVCLCLFITTYISTLIFFIPVFFSIIIGLLLCSAFLILLLIVKKIENLFENMVQKFIKKIKLNEYENNIIKKYSNNFDFYTSKKNKDTLLDSLIKENINTIDYNNLEEFLNILKNNNLINLYLPLVIDKLNKSNISIKYFYITDENFDNNQYSKEILITLKFLNENPKFKLLILEELYLNCSLSDLIENEAFLNKLSVEQLVNKITEKYTLKELTNSLFFNSAFNNPYFKIEIFNILNLLNNENKTLINKFVIEQVLSKKEIKIINIIEDCYINFLNCADNLDIKDQHILFEIKSIFLEKQLISNNNLKILHI